MEAAVGFLREHYKHVLVRAIYATQLPIRFRPKKLDGVYLGLQADTGEISRWLAKGGVLVNYRLHNPPHDVHLLCECPFSLAALRLITCNTAEFAVIYKPPSWRAHREEISLSWPDSETCRKLHADIAAATIQPDHLAICKALDKPAEGLTVIADDEIKKRFGIGAIHLKRLRKTILRGVISKAYFTVMRLIPRVEPEDKSLIPLYRAVEALPKAGGVCLALGRTLYAASNLYKKQLRALVRCGSVANLGALGFYAVADIQPDFGMIQARHESAKAALEEIISAVDAAPELTAELRPSPPAQPQRSGARARRAGAAPARDTPD